MAIVKYLILLLATSAFANEPTISIKSFKDVQRLGGEKREVMIIYTMRPDSTLVQEGIYTSFVFPSADTSILVLPTDYYESKVEKVIAQDIKFDPSVMNQATKSLIDSIGKVLKEQVDASKRGR